MLGSSILSLVFGLVLVLWLVYVGLGVKSSFSIRGLIVGVLVLGV